MEHRLAAVIQPHVHVGKFVLDRVHLGIEVEEIVLRVEIRNRAGVFGRELDVQAELRYGLDKELFHALAHLVDGGWNAIAEAERIERHSLNAAPDGGDPLFVNAVHAVHQAIHRGNGARGAVGVLTEAHRCEN